MTTDFSQWNAASDIWTSEPEQADKVTCVRCKTEIERLRYVKAQRAQR